MILPTHRRLAATVSLLLAAMLAPAAATLAIAWHLGSAHGAGDHHGAAEHPGTEVGRLVAAGDLALGGHPHHGGSGHAHAPSELKPGTRRVEVRDLPEPGTAVTLAGSWPCQGPASRPASDCEEPPGSPPSLAQLCILRL